MSSEYNLSTLQKFIAEITAIRLAFLCFLTVPFQSVQNPSSKHMFSVAVSIFGLYACIAVIDFLSEQQIPKKEEITQLDDLFFFAYLQDRVKSV